MAAHPTTWKIYAVLVPLVTQVKQPMEKSFMDATVWDFQETKDTSGMPEVSYD